MNETLKQYKIDNDLANKRTINADKITNKKANDNEGSGIFIKKNENPASTVNTATTTKHFMQPVYVKSLNQSKLILKIPQPTQKPYLEHFRRHQYKLY